MEKMKKIIYIIFGVKENLRLKIALSFFIMCIIFFLFLINSPDNSKEYMFFMIAFDISFSLGLLIAKGVDSTLNFVVELTRLVIFLGFLFFSIYFFYFFIFYSGIRLVIFASLACIGLITSLFYFVSLFTTIFNFAKALFNTFKNKLFGSIHSTEDKAKSFTAFIENVSALLVAIGGLVLTVRGIIEPIINIVRNYIQSN